MRQPGSEVVILSFPLQAIHFNAVAARLHVMPSAGTVHDLYVPLVHQPAWTHIHATLHDLFADNLARVTPFSPRPCVVRSKYNGFKWGDSTQVSEHAPASIARPFHCLRSSALSHSCFPKTRNPQVCTPVYITSAVSNCTTYYSRLSLLCVPTLYVRTQFQWGITTSPRTHHVP